MRDMTLTRPSDEGLVPDIESLARSDQQVSDLPDVEYDFGTEATWRSIPAWSQVGRDEFSSHSWQLRNSVTSLDQLAQVLGDRLSSNLLEDLRAGQQKAGMNLRLTPYVLAQLNWENAEADPLRRQFLPLGSEQLPDHPMHRADSLNEDGDRKAPFLTHRYHDKALFLPTTICPVYCTYCTRSRVVGGSTQQRSKKTYGAKRDAWEETFAYIRKHPELEDIVVSGGDSSMLKAEQLEWIGRELLEIPHIRRIRIATKGIAILPMQYTDDEEWLSALGRVCDLGRERFKEVCIHTHVGSEYELSGWTLDAMKRLVEMGIKVRNQSVLLRGVNDRFDQMYRLIKKLSWLNIQPYYVYAHDMVPACEHLRTSIAAAESLSKTMLGTTAGFNLPRFVCDAPGGGGKREISSYEYYDRTKGISAWIAPSIKPGQIFYYFDPLNSLPDEGRAFWAEVGNDRSHLDSVLGRIERRLNLEFVR